MYDGSKTNWLLIFLLLLVGLFAAAQFGKLTLTLEYLREVYGSSGALLISVVGVVGILFGAVAGASVSRIGMARAVLGAALLGGFISLFQASLPGFPAMASLRVIEGLSHLAIVVAAPTLMAAHATDRDRPVVMGIWAAFFGISLALTAVLLPSLLAAGGLQAVFIAHGLGMFVVAAALWPVLPRARITEPQPVRFLDEHLAIYSSPRLLIAGGGFVFYTILYIALLAVLPELLELPIWAMALPPLVSLVGTFVAGFLARTIDPARLAMIGFALTIFFMLCLFVAVVPLSAFGVSVLLLLFMTMGLIPGASFAAIPHYNSENRDRARATGGIAQLGNVGTTTGTPIFVAAGSGGGLAAVTMVLVLFCALGIATLMVLRARIK